MENYKDKNIVLFDGVCNLCNGAVNFLIDRDKDNKLHFASLQSEVGQAILKEYQMDMANFDTFIFLKKGTLFMRSGGALEVVRILGGAWAWLSVFKIVPTFLRDGIYTLISKNRYKIFGKQESCRMPTPELKAKFL